MTSMTRSRVALVPLLLIFTGCERVETADGLLEPPPRVGASAPSATAAPQPAVPIPPVAAAARDEPPGSQGALSQLTVLDPRISAPVLSYSLLTVLPDTAPPRAIVRGLDGREWVVKLGERLGEEGAIVSAIGPADITVTTLRLDQTASVVRLAEVRLPAEVPATASKAPTETSATGVTEPAPDMTADPD